MDYWDPASTPQPPRDFRSLTMKMRVMITFWRSAFYRKRKAVDEAIVLWPEPHPWS